MFNCGFVEKHQRQLRNLLRPDSHESGGVLFGRLASLYSCVEWANWKDLDFVREVHYFSIAALPLGRCFSFPWPFSR